VIVRSHERETALDKSELQKLHKTAIEPLPNKFSLLQIAKDNEQLDNTYHVGMRVQDFAYCLHQFDMHAYFAEMAVSDPNNPGWFLKTVNLFVNYPGVTLQEVLNWLSISGSGARTMRSIMSNGPRSSSWHPVMRIFVIKSRNNTAYLMTSRKEAQWYPILWCPLSHPQLKRQREHFSIMWPSCRFQNCRERIFILWSVACVVRLCIWNWSIACCRIFKVNSFRFFKQLPLRISMIRSDWWNLTFVLIGHTTHASTQKSIFYRLLRTHTYNGLLQHGDWKGASVQDPHSSNARNHHGNNNQCQHLVTSPQSGRLNSSSQPEQESSEFRSKW